MYGLRADLKKKKNSLLQIQGQSGSRLAFAIHTVPYMYNKCIANIDVVSLTILHATFF